MKKEMKKSGFTLVEIMIVVAIIGLLAAIGIPSFNKARSNARTNKCINNLRITDASKEQYGMDEDVTTGTAVTMVQISDYVKGGSGTLVCPEGDTDYTDTSVGNLGTNPTCPNAATFTAHVL